MLDTVSVIGENSRPWRVPELVVDEEPDSVVPCSELPGGSGKGQTKMCWKQPKLHGMGWDDGWRDGEVGLAGAGCQSQSSA